MSTESERLAIAVDVSRRMGIVVGFIAGAFTSIVGTVFVIARWFARCHSA